MSVPSMDVRNHIAVPVDYKNTWTLIQERYFPLDNWINISVHLNVTNVTRPSRRVVIFENTNEHTFQSRNTHAPFLNVPSPVRLVSTLKPTNFFTQHLIPTKYFFPFLRMQCWFSVRSTRRAMRHFAKNISSVPTLQMNTLTCPPTPVRTRTKAVKPRSQSKPNSVNISKNVTRSATFVMNVMPDSYYYWTCNDINGTIIRRGVLPVALNVLRKMSCWNISRFTRRHWTRESGFRVMWRDVGNGIQRPTDWKLMWIRFMTRWNHMFVSGRAVDGVLGLKRCWIDMCGRIRILLRLENGREWSRKSDWLMGLSEPEIPGGILRVRFKDAIINLPGIMI